MAKRITLTSLWGTEPLSKRNENTECSNTSDEEIQLTDSQLRVDRVHMTSYTDDDCVISLSKLQDSPTVCRAVKRFESGTIFGVTTEDYQGKYYRNPSMYAY